MEVCMRDFFWLGVLKKKIHLVRWDSLIQPRKNSGLGIKDISLDNQALLFKWIWRFNQQHDSLWAQVLKAKYSFQSESGISLVVGNNLSPMWKDIQKFLRTNGSFSILNNISSAIGNGESTKFWYDKLLGEVPLKFHFGRLFNLCSNPDTLISDLGWENGTWTWKFF